MRSGVMESGMTMTARYPRAAAIIARDIPMLPDVGSTMVPPSFSSPRATASSMIDRAGLSFTDPPGLHLSVLTYTCVPGGAILLRRTMGVSPIVSVMLL